MKKNYLLIILLIFASCKDDNHIVETYNKLTKIQITKRYDSNKKLIKTTKSYKGKPNSPYNEFINKIDYDSLIYYYKNGRVFKEGKITRDSFAVGTWNYYDRNGVIREIRDYIILNKEVILNKIEFFDSVENLIHKRPKSVVFEQTEFQYDTININTSNFTYFQFNKDTFKLNEPLRAIAMYDTRYLSTLNSETRVYVEAYDYEDLLFDFSNISQNEDTVFHSLAKDTVNRKYFINIEPKDYRYSVPFGFYFNSSGKKVIRGFIEEYAIDTLKNKYDTITARTYFQKNIFVKDSLKK